MSRETLLRRILESPDDTALRLVLADYLIEHGEQEWGELISAQCELARRIGEGEGELVDLVQRVAWLAPLQEAVWRKQLDGLVHHIWLERGFPERVSVGLEDVDGTVARILALAPVRVVRLLRGKAPLEDTTLRQIATTKALDRLDGLELIRFFDYGQADAGIRLLLEAPCRLLNLRYLAITENRLATETLRFLGEQPWQRLERLDLASAIRNETGLVALLEGAGIRQLRSIGLLNLDLGDRGAETLAHAAHLTRLGALTLRGVTARGVAALVAAPHLQTLRELRTAASNIGPEGARVLAAAPLHYLQTLSLSNSEIFDDGLRAIAASTSLPRLRNLVLAGNAITDAGASALLQAPAKLQHVDLRSNPAITKAMRARLRDHFGLGVCVFSRD